MHHTIEMRVRGEREIVDFYIAAVGRWNEIWKRPESHDFQALARILSSEQQWFEKYCGGRSLGQEIMVVSGFGVVFNSRDASEQAEGSELAEPLYDAFQSSLCSIEVKWIADEVASSYDLLGSSSS